jgi:TetR/AcrR family transcriptional regulator, transcriptional repressor for nem operon
MKVSKATAAANREALLSAAGRLYREKGFDAVSIADIGASAGLTHGAVYGHFASKDALQSAAVGDLFGWTAAQARGAGDIAALLDRYLSRVHVENPGAGCPLAALSGDTARQDTAVRDGFARGLEDTIEELVALIGRSRDTPGSRPEAISSIAAMVGAVALARASGDKALAEEVLATVRNDLSASLLKA